MVKSAIDVMRELSDKINEKNERIAELEALLRRWYDTHVVDGGCNTTLELETIQALECGKGEADAE